MAREATAKCNFNSGEFSPRLFGRTDVDKYYNGVARMRGFLPMPFGGCDKTPGTVFASEVRDSTEKGRLFDWVFGSGQAYVLQFNDSKIRFYKDRGILTGDNPVAITGITNANPGVVTATAHGLSNGDHIIINGIDGMTEVNGIEFIVANKTNDTFELTDVSSVNVDTTSYGVFLDQSYTKLILHLDTNATDSSASGHTSTFAGGAEISTVQKKFGAGSLLLTNSGDWLTIPASDDFVFGTGNFTVDVWVRPTTTDPQNAISIYGASSSGWQIGINSSGKAFFLKDGGTQINGSTGIIANTWNHIAYSRWGTGANQAALFLNGAVEWLGQDDTNYSNSHNLTVGCETVVDRRNQFKGYIDDPRITKGAARWSAAFTPPTAPSPVGESSTVAGVYEIAQTYDEDDLFEIQTAQAGDIMYLAGDGYAPMKLSRLAETTWTLAAVDFIDGPYLDQNETATTLDPSGTSGSVTVSASATTGINGGSGFLATDVGRLIRIKYSTTWYWLKITAVTNTTTVTATVQASATMSAHTATAEWCLGAFSATTGYPRAVAFYQGRLWWAGTSTQPQNVWGSVSLDYENMNPGTAADADAITYQLNSNRVNIIKWMASAKRLLIGTEGENFTLYSGTSTEPVTQTNIRADSETNYGSANIAPVKVGSYLYYVQEDEKTLREFYYDFTVDSYRSINKTILSEHITQGKIKQMAYQKAPYGIIWCVLKDGSLVTFTREIEQEVNGWADQTPTDDRPDDEYESVVAIPTTDGYTEIWFLVKRLINGVEKRYVEYQVSPNQAIEENLEDMIYMHSALSHTGSASSISGLDHLEGEDVVILADGNVIEKTVENGEIDLGGTYQKIHVGLRQTGQIKLLPLEAGSKIGTSQGMKKRTSEINVRVYRTLGLTVGEEDGNMEEVLRDGMGAVHTTLQTDDFTVPSTLGWDEKQQLLFEQSDPLPATILQVAIYEFTSEEKSG